MLFFACVPLIESDLTDVLDLDQRCLGGLWTRSGYQREIESDCSDLLVLVQASKAETIKARTKNARTGPAHSQMSILGVGCLWAVLEEAHITTLAIDLQHQGQKLGLLLLSELLDYGQKRGLTRATLEVRVSNQKALNLYQKFGFEEAGQRKKYYSDGESARILWRSGLQTNACYRQIQQHHESAVAALQASGEQTVLTNATWAGGKSPDRQTMQFL